MFASTAVLAALAASPALAAFADYNFVVSNVNAAPDGFERSVVAVNGQIPGTLITANKGDTLRINTTNMLTDSTMRRATTIHWHGLFQASTAMEDGPAFVTQCPISQFNSYTYEIPLHDQTGTFWYHSHLSSQYVDGLRGPLVIYDPDDPQKNLYDVDDASTVITLADWYHDPAPVLQEQFFSTSNTALNAPVPDSALINGAGRYVGGTEVKRAVLNVTPGKRYRFRVINISAIGSFTFSIEGHMLTIIEADGIAHEPLVVDSFDIFAGQRYSVIVEANQTVANYWVRAPMTVAAAGTNTNLDPTNVFAVLHYDGAADAEPTTEQGTAIGNAPLELVITGGANHPIHLHGHAFDVVRSLGGSINYVNPPRRDVTDNPGPWFLHCHIDWHLEAGLAVVFAESPDEIRTGTQKVAPNAAWDQLCPKYQALSADLQ
ncbi:laccase [Ceratobasidium sp. 370]|nr:laccase [Ceratobasidium sp. 370]